MSDVSCAKENTPMLGATVAGFILVPTLLAEKGLTAAIIMLVVILVYQQLENHVRATYELAEAGP